MTIGTDTPAYPPYFITDDPAKQDAGDPASGQGFEVTWRLFAPQPARIDGILDGSGWQPPAICPFVPGG